MNIKCSIILCTRNGASKIAKSIESILNQNYPSNLFEIIVVDDGSTDDTYSIVSKYKVRIISYPKSKGLAQARNTGLEVSKGQIIICYDDDCIASKNWLANLMDLYEDPSVFGAGGFVTVDNNSTFTDKYCYYSGYGNAIPLTYSSNPNILKRFFNYIYSNFSFQHLNYVNGSAVHSLPGILSSFRSKYLKAVGGWSKEFYAMEDIDLCDKLYSKYRNCKFVVSKDATVVHEQQLSLLNFLTKEFKRGAIRRYYYKSKNLTLPIFPLPIVFVVIFFVLGILKINILVIFLLPFILYPWWVIQSITTKSFEKLSYSYVQLLHELSILTGMIYVKK